MDTINTMNNTDNSLKTLQNIEKELSNLIDIRSNPSSKVKVQ